MSNLTKTTTNLTDDFNLYSIKNISSIPLETENCLAFFYPFYFSNFKNIKKIEKLIIHNIDNVCWDNDKIISYKTRCYDYIMSFLGAKSTIAEKNENNIRPVACFKRGEISECETQSIMFEMVNCLNGNAITPNREWRISTSKKYIYLFDNKLKKKIPIKLIPVNYRFYTFNSGVGFFGLFFELKGMRSKAANKRYLNFTEENFFDLLFCLKQTAKNSCFSDYIKLKLRKLLKNEEINFFEEKETNQLKSGLRATFFSNISYTSITPVEKCKIPRWMTGQLSIKISKNKNLYNNSSISLCENNLISYSTEGCCSIYQMNNCSLDLKRYLEANISNFCQHTLIIYILVLHQAYYLHYITEKAANSSEKLYSIEAIEKMYTNFRKIHMYQRISPIEKYHNLYSQMQFALQLENFSQEAKYTIEPMRDWASKKVERRKSTILALITGSSMVNVIINIFNAKYNECLPSNLVLGISIGSSAILICLILAISFSFFDRFKNHFKKIIFKIKKFLKRRKND